MRRRVVTIKDGILQEKRCVLIGKVKKILAGVLVVVIAGSGITAGLMQLKKNSQKTVAVTPVSGLLQEFYTPSTTLDRTITSSPRNTDSKR